KPLDADEFLARVRRLIARSRPGRENSAAGEREFDLTKRELEVLHLLAEGSRASDIATKLVISEKTVASHIQRMLVKLGVHSRAQAVALAYQVGLITRHSGSTGETEAHAFLGILKRRLVGSQHAARSWCVSHSFAEERDDHHRESQRSF